MFDIGFAELLVLTIIAMVVVGPEKLPGLARSVGKTVGQARRFMTGIQNQIEQEVKLDELNKKIMAETKELDISKDFSLNHQNEDAETPQHSPDETSEDEHLHEGLSPDDDEEHSIHSGLTVNDEDKTDDTQRS